MHHSTIQKQRVVKKYHTLINKEYRVRELRSCRYFYLFYSIFSFAYERKLNTGCGTAFNIAVPNRQLVELPNFGLANSPSKMDMSEKTTSPQRATNAVQAPDAGLLSLFWGFVQGGFSLYVY